MEVRGEGKEGGEKNWSKEEEGRVKSNKSMTTKKRRKEK